MSHTSHHHHQNKKTNHDHNGHPHNRWNDQHLSQCMKYQQTIKFVQYESGTPTEATAFVLCLLALDQKWLKTWLNMLYTLS